MKIRGINENILTSYPHQLDLFHSIEDLHPFAHIEADDEKWTNAPENEFIDQQLITLGIDSKSHLIVDMNHEDMYAKICDYLGKEIQKSAHRDVLFREQLADKMQLFFGVEPAASADLISEVSFIVGGTGRVRMYLIKKATIFSALV